MKHTSEKVFPRFLFKRHHLRVEMLFGEQAYYGASRTCVSDGGSALGERRDGCWVSQYPRPWAEPAGDDALPFQSVSPPLLCLSASNSHLMQHYIHPYKRKLTCMLALMHSPANSLSLHPYFEPCSRFFFPQGQCTAGSYQGSYPGEGGGM